jgi:hypothetical protein
MVLTKSDNFSIVDAAQLILVDLSRKKNTRLLKLLKVLPFLKTPNAWKLLPFYSLQY